MHRWVLTTTLLLTIIKLLKVGALLPIFPPESPALILDPHPPNPSEVGVVILSLRLWRAMGRPGLFAIKYCF